MEYYGWDLIPTASGITKDLRMRFTKENAAHYSKLANDARWHTAKPETIPIEQTGTISENPYPTVDTFIQQRIARVRKQIERVSCLIDEEEDASAIDRLAAALSRLSTLEREYAMRPAPGTLKPTAPSKPSGPPGGLVPGQ